MAEKIEIKNKEEIEKIKKASQIASTILKYLSKEVKPNVSSKYLNDLAYKLMKKYKVEPAFLNYNGYPASICVCLNNELVHGIPYENKILKNGDIVSIDIGVKYDGFYGDIAYTFPVGNINENAKKIINVTYNAIYEALNYVKPNNRIGDISHAIQSFVEKNKYNVVRDFAGHGIGRNLHEKPEVPNFGQPDTGPKLFPGMVLAIEPMVCEGHWELKIKDDNWTVITADGKLCAHFEVIIAVTENGYEVLTEFP